MCVELNFLITAVSHAVEITLCSGVSASKAGKCVLNFGMLSLSERVRGNELLNR